MTDYTEGFWDGYKAGLADQNLSTCHFCGTSLTPATTHYSETYDPATKTATTFTTCGPCITPATTQATQGATDA